MAQCGDRLLALDEVPDDLLELRVIAQVFGGAAAAENDPIVALRPHVREGDICRDAVAGLFNIGVPAGLEIVHHGAQHLLRGRSDVDFDAFLAATMVGIPGVEGFGGVSGHEQYLEHEKPPAKVRPIILPRRFEGRCPRRAGG